MQILLVSENPTNGCFRRHSDMKDFLVQVNGSRDLISERCCYPTYKVYVIFREQWRQAASTSLKILVSLNEWPELQPFQSRLHSESQELYSDGP